MSEEEAKFYREGESANDNNRRCSRTRKGQYQWNPYPQGSAEWKLWNDGYQYRDMVNDG